MEDDLEVKKILDCSDDIEDTDSDRLREDPENVSRNAEGIGAKDGKDRIGTLVECVLRVIDDLPSLESTRTGPKTELSSSSAVGGRPMEMADGM
ncbi:hypothetical protein FS842_007125 [Serendipita sp. 407]|nr:hypothetical protein FRC15_008882 [Serendipita sp. 397]KAG8865446.1 hypothetical protein FRC20_009828 [Serendipita sp. 405]KAG9053800.1 hypothetical protein FS842_007125 [Serendipita sp. 407]